MFGSGCPVAIHVKLWVCPATITDVTGGFMILGMSEKFKSVINAVLKKNRNATSYCIILNWQNLCKTKEMRLLNEHIIDSSI